MALTKQAKILTDAQIRAVLNHVQESSRYPLRDRVMVLLSTKAGMRAKEIACLTWGMVTDSEGKLTSVISLPNRASKGKSSGRHIPMHAELSKALVALQEDLGDQAQPNRPIMYSERSKLGGYCPRAVVNLFAKIYAELGFTGASSHSGRRTFITNAARKISSVGGSLRDVQKLAGHAALTTTERYIESSQDAMNRVVALL